MVSRWWADVLILVYINGFFCLFLLLLGGEKLSLSVISHIGMEREQPSVTRDANKT